MVPTEVKGVQTDAVKIENFYQKESKVAAPAKVEMKSVSVQVQLIEPPQPGKPTVAANQDKVLGTVSGSNAKQAAAA